MFLNYVLFLFNYLVCCYGPKQQRIERRILLKSLLNVFHKTDIFAVFNKIREIDIMLYLFLNDKQRQVVKYIQREQIVFNEKNQHVNYYASDDDITIKF